MEIQILRFNRTYLPSIVDLLNEEYKDTYEFFPFDNERILSQKTKRDLKVFVAKEDRKILGVLAKRIEERGEENIFWLAAHAGPKRKSVEDELVSEFEKTVEGDVVSTAIDEKSPRIPEWINRGYSLNPGWLRMSTKLDELKPIPAVAEGIGLRSLMLDEEEKLVEAMNAGFGWQRLEKGMLAKWKSEDTPFDEEWVQVAEFKDRIVSAVVARPDTEYNKYLQTQRGYLGPASTLPEFRNRHLASALTLRAMNYIYEKGMKSVRLGTSEQNLSSIALLKTLGFQVDVVRKVLRKKLEKS